MKFPMNTRVLVKTTEHYDFYIHKTSNCWYIEAFPVGTLDHTKKTLAGQSTLKSAKHTVEVWAENFEKMKRAG